MRKNLIRKILIYSSITLLLIFTIVFIIFKKQKVEKPLTESEEIEQRLNNMVIDKKSIYDESKISKIEEYKDEDLGIKINYPENWESEQTGEIFDDENITNINLLKGGYLVNFYITDKNWSYDSDGGLTTFGFIKENSYLINSKIIYSIPKLDKPFDNPPYNSEMVIFFNETDFRYFKDSNLGADTISYTGFVYNGKTGITVRMQSPKGEETINPDIINEIYYILANVDFYYGV